MTLSIAIDDCKVGGCQLTRPQIRGVILWPDGVERKTEWLADTHEKIAIDARIDAVLKILNGRPAVQRAKLIWEHRDDS